MERVKNIPPPQSRPSIPTSCCPRVCLPEPQEPQEKQGISYTQQMIQEDDEESGCDCKHTAAGKSDPRLTASVCCLCVCFPSFSPATTKLFPSSSSPSFPSGAFFPFFHTRHVSPDSRSDEGEKALFLSSPAAWHLASGSLFLSLLRNHSSSFS